jgi:hypothetical protein
MKILVFMSDNRSIGSDFDTACYVSLVACINAAYCKKYGYDFVYYQPYFKTQFPFNVFNCKNFQTGVRRDAAWSKLLSTIKALRAGYDYIVYIDSDCIFKDFTKNIESYILANSDKDIVFLNNKPWNTDKPCSGFFICPVTSKVEDMIRQWYAVDLPAKNENRAWEQDGLWEIYQTFNAKILDEWMFQEEEGQYLRHITSYQTGGLRVPYFKDFILKHGLSMKNNEFIKQIAFDTSDATQFGF